MTDHDLATALDRLTTSVNNHKVEIATSVATLSTKVDNLKESQDKLTTKVETVATNQASCEARNGHPGTNARIKRLEQKSSDDRIHVESELGKMRGDATGQTDVIANRMAMLAGSKSDSNGIIKTFGPWIAKGLLILGLGIGGGLVARLGVGSDDTDSENTARMIRYVVEIAHKMENTMTELEDITETSNEKPVPVSVMPYEEESYQ